MQAKDPKAEDLSGETYYGRLMRWRRIVFVHGMLNEFDGWWRQHPKAEMMEGVRLFEKKLGLDPHYPAK